MTLPCGTSATSPTLAPSASAQADSFISDSIYTLSKLEWILDGMVLYPANMLANLQPHARSHTSPARCCWRWSTPGITREEAYKIVQRNSMEVWDDIQQARPGKTLRERREADPRL